MRRREFMAAALAASLPAWAAANRFDRGLLWRVRKEGSRPSHVYGTIHVADARLAQLPPPVRRALDGARSVMLEFVPDGYTRERFIEAAMFLDRQTLEGTIGKPDFERALEVLAPIGLPREVVNKLKPWGVLLNLRDLQRAQEGTPLDAQLIEIARQLEELRVERRPVLGARGIAQVEEHAPGLELVHHFARQADRREMLERALEVLAPDLFLERLAVEEHRRLEEALARVRVGHELEHQAARGVEAPAHRGRQLGEARVGDVDRAVDVARPRLGVRHAPQEPAAKALLGRPPRRRRGGKAGGKEDAPLHRPGPSIASARTQRSKSSALT